MIGSKLLLVCFIPVAVVNAAGSACCPPKKVLWANLSVNGGMRSTSEQMSPVASAQPGVRSFLEGEIADLIKGSYVYNDDRRMLAGSVDGNCTASRGGGFVLPWNDAEGDYWEFQGGWYETVFTRYSYDFSMIDSYWVKGPTGEPGTVDRVVVLKVPTPPQFVGNWGSITNLPVGAEPACSFAKFTGIDLATAAAVPSFTFVVVVPQENVDAWNSWNESTLAPLFSTPVCAASSCQVAIVVDTGDILADATTGMYSFGMNSCTPCFYSTTTTSTVGTATFVQTVTTTSAATSVSVGMWTTILFAALATLF